MIFVLAFIVLLFIGVPIAATVGLTTVAYLISSGNLAQYVTVYASRAFNGMNSFELMAIPLFVLAGDLLYEGKISQTLVDLASSIIGSVKGGLAMVTTLACMFFGAVSGSGPATSAAIGAVVRDPMVEEGYPKDFIAATVAASGPLGTLIPPSVLMVVYGCTTGVPIASLLMAGIIPGIIYGGFMMLYQHWISKKKDYGQQHPFSWSRLATAFRKSLLALVVPVIILGGIYSGLFTPTEAAVVAVAYAFIIGMFVYKSITWKSLPRILRGSAITTTTIMFITANIAMLAWVLTRERIPETLAALAISSVKTPMMFVVVSNIILFFAGMVEAGSSCIILLAPLLYPIAAQFGIDPVFYGAMFVANLAVGMITPPVAATLYVGQRVVGVDITSIIKQVWPYVFIQLLALAFCIVFPQTFTFLPNLLA